MSETVAPVRVTAGAPTSVLISSLARAYWGVLEGQEWRACRIVLQALPNLAYSKRSRAEFDYRGRVYATASQLTGITGYSEKWTRKALQALEDMGVIRWCRGMIVGGKPTASLFTVIKRRLVDLIKFARPRARRIDEEKRNSFIKRLADILVKRRGSDGSMRAPESVRIPSKAAGGIHTNELQTRSRWSIHAELSNSPSTLVGGSPAKGGTIQQKKSFRSMNEDNSGAVDLFSASANSADSSSALSPNSKEISISNYKEIEMVISKPQAHLDRLPTICPHGEIDPYKCIDCIDGTRDKDAMEQYRRKLKEHPAYQRALRRGYFDISDQQIIKDRATQIAIEQAKTRVFKDRSEWMNYIVTTANQLTQEFEAAGESVLWP